jgi:hypothetical protein
VGAFVHRYRNTLDAPLPSDEQARARIVWLTVGAEGLEPTTFAL